MTRRQSEHARALLHAAECSTHDGLEASRLRSRARSRAEDAILTRHILGEPPTVLEAVRWLVACEAEEPGGSHVGAWDAMRRAISTEG